MKLSTFVSLAFVLPMVHGLKGAKSSQLKQRALKGDDGDDSGGGIDDIIGSACFSGATQVDVAGRGLVDMQDLSVGDQVLTGANQYESVYAFGHYEPTKAANFVSIETSEAKPLEMTSQHLVYLQGKSNPVRAESIKVGDVLRTLTSSAKVVSVDSVQRQGLYAPFTSSGSVVVNGIVASNYISLQDADEYVEMKDGVAILSQHDFLHRALSPFRMLVQGLGVTFGFDDNGIATYVANGIKLAHWAEEQFFVVQCSLFVAFLFVTGSFMAVEHAVGAAYAPWAMMAAAVAYLVYNKSRTTSSKLKSV